MALNIPILSSLDTKGFDKARREFGKLEGASAKSAYAIKKAAIPAAAAIAGLATVAVMATKAAVADEAAQVKLAGTLQRTVGATTGVVTATERYIDRLSRASSVADDELRPALSTLLLGTKDLGKAQELLSVGLDLSASSGKDLGTVVEALSRGYAGNTKGLRTLSPEIAALIKGGADFSEVLTVLKANFGGASEEAANTAAGGFRKIKNAINETVEGIGKKLLPAIDYLLPGLIKIGEWAQDNTGYLVAVGFAVGGIATALVLTSAGLAVWNTAAALTTAVNAGLASSYFAVQIATGIGIATAVAGGIALGILAIKIKNIIGDAAKAQQAATTGNTGSVRAFEESQKSATKVTEAAAKVTGTNTAADTKAAAAKAKLKAAAKVLAEELVKLKDALRDQMAAALEKANIVLDEAVAKFDAFASSVSDAVKSSYSFSNAQNSATQNTEALAEASADVAKAQKAVAKAIAGTDPEALATAYEDLAEANKKLNSAQSAPMTFLENLREQANKVKDFGVLINRLLAAGISPAALQQVVAAGADAGSLIANELLNTAGGVLEANALTADVNSVAETVGQNSAAQFFQAGVTAGQNLVNGIQSVVDGYTIRIPGATTAEEVGAIAGGFATDVGAVMAGPTAPIGGYTAEELAAAEALAAGLFGDIPLLAAGGIVTAPTLAMIGEGNGPEAVIPLNQMGNYGGGGGMNITVQAGLISTPDQIGQQIIEAIQRAQRRSGTVFAPA